MGQHGLVEEKSANHGIEAHHEPHVLSIGLYLMVFGILIVGTILTVIVASFDLDQVFTGANTLMALLIAFVKTSFVVLFFMHVKYSGKLVWLCAVGAILWLGIMFAFKMSDYLTPGMTPQSILS